MARYGWFINVGRCDYLDAGTTKAFNVNLVRPWSDAETPQNDREPALAAADTALGTLLFPWMWTDTRWQVCAWLAAGNAADPTPRWQTVDAADVRFEFGTPDLLADGTPDRVRRELMQEVQAQTGQCGYPFSRAIDDYWGRASASDPVTARSHVHALAPLTHWPATASGPLLRLSGLLHVESASLVDATTIACFPAFSFERGSPAAAEAATPALPAAAAGGDLGKSFAVSSYASADIGFACLVAALDGKLPTRPTPEVGKSQGQLSIADLYALASRHVTPLALLSTWVQQLVADVGGGGADTKDASLQAAAKLLADAGFVQAARDVLWRAIGYGWEPAPPRQYRHNVTEWLTAGDFNTDAAAVQRALLRPPSLAPVDPYAVLGQVLNGAGDWPGLARQAVGPSWTDASVARWRTFGAWLGTPPDTASRPALLAHWNRWLGAAAVLLSDDGLREILGPWLSFVQDAAFGVGPNQVPWPTGVRENLRTLGAVRSDLVARTRPEMMSETQRNAFPAIANAPGFDVDAAGLLQASKTAMNTDLGDAAWNTVTAATAALASRAFEQHVKDRIGALQAVLNKAGSSARPRGRDLGLRLNFQSIEPDGGPAQLTEWDQQIRGYAIGLCAGTTSGRADDPAAIWSPDLGRAQWITDTALRVKGTGAAGWLQEDTGRTAWMHDTVGSTDSNGTRVVWVEYNGHPLATALGDPAEGVRYDDNGEQGDGFDIVDFAWRADERPLPLLAFGACYRAIAATIDNAGAVIEVGLRGATTPSTLVAARDVPDFQASKPLQCFQYRSSQPPGQPRVMAAPSASLFELSDETQAHAYQAYANAGVPGAAGATKPVALLGYLAGQPAFLKSTVRPSCTLTWAPPQVHADFFRGWIDADRLLAATGSAQRSDPNLAAMNDAQIDDFATRTVAATRTPTNPAVSAIGVEIFDPLAGIRTSFAVPFDRTTAGANGVLAQAAFTLSCDIDAAPDGTATASSAPVGGRFTLTVGQGRFVRIRTFSLVEASHFDPANGTQARFADGIAPAGADVPAFAGYAAFGPSEHWVEVMPAWSAALAAPSAAVQLQFMAPSAADDAPTAPDLALLRADIQSDGWVAWNKGVLVQRHEWHWTGYPVALPQGSNVDDWLASFAGVQSFREVASATFATSFVTLDHGARQWRVGASGDNADIVQRWGLPSGARPARYAAFFARPLVRFAAWLDPAHTAEGPLQLQQLVFASGAVVPGKRPSDGNQRLPAPVPRWTLPLTANHGGPGGSGNGVMMVFDDALRRTDDQARHGGIGETLEVDLLETRLSGFPEIGLNPIFHPRDASGATPITVSAQPPFGLTFDDGANPKVAQTALVVQPRGAAGRWVMAKLRTRRLILPETELSSRLAPATGTDDALALARATLTDPAAQQIVDAPGVQVFELPMRADGEDAVPMDAAIDLDALPPGAAPALHLLVASGGAASLLTLAVPPGPSGGSASPRLLASWHKDRWVQSEDPSWRCQLLRQSQQPGQMSWDLEARTSGYANAQSQLPPHLQSGRCWLVVDSGAARATTVRQARMSDYTPPAWTTFIGSFGTTELGQATDYRLAPLGTSGDLMTLWSPSPDIEQPQLWPLDVGSAESRFHLALVFKPVRDLTRGEPEAGTGALVAVFMATGRGGGFKRLPLHASNEAPLGPADLRGCSAYVIALQRATALSADERKLLSPGSQDPKDGIDSFDTLLDRAFPEQSDRVRESLLRFLPEYLGPIAVG